MTKRQKPNSNLQLIAGMGMVMAPDQIADLVEALRKTSVVSLSLLLLLFLSLSKQRRLGPFVALDSLSSRLCDAALSSLRCLFGFVVVRSSRLCISSRLCLPGSVSFLSTCLPSFRLCLLGLCFLGSVFSATTSWTLGSVISALPSVFSTLSFRPCLLGCVFSVASSFVSSSWCSVFSVLSNNFSRLCLCRLGSFRFAEEPTNLPYILLRVYCHIGCANPSS